MFGLVDKASEGDVWEASGAAVKEGKAEEQVPLEGSWACSPQGRTVVDYALFELATTLWVFYPHLGSFSTASQRSIYDSFVFDCTFPRRAPRRLPRPLHLVLHPRLPSRLHNLHLPILPRFSGGGAYHSSLLRPEFGARLRYPPLFNNWMLSRSLRDFWEVQWHGIYQAVLRFSGCRPGRKAAGKAGGIVGIMYVSIIPSPFLSLFAFVSGHLTHLHAHLHLHLHLPSLTFDIKNAYLLPRQRNLPPRRSRHQLPLEDLRLGLTAQGLALICLALSSRPLADTWLRTGASAGLGGEEGVLP
jgi:hypothetical protein